MHNDNRDRALALQALQFMLPHRAETREHWIATGMALHSISSNDEMLEAWLAWSAGSDKYDEAECRRQWRSFRESADGVGVGTLLWMADQDTPSWRETTHVDQRGFEDRREPTPVLTKRPPLVFEDMYALTKSIERRIDGRAVGTWLYFELSDEGTEREAFGVIRFDLQKLDPETGKPKKEFRPFHPERGSGAQPLRVVLGYPEGKLVPYCLPEILEAEAGEIIFVCEGEKAADALRIRADLTATTSAGGCKASKRTEWSSLRGRDVILVPDNDEAGRQWASRLRKILAGPSVGASVRVLQLSGLPNKGDAVDYLDSNERSNHEH